jgi:hypothetical protein
MIGLLIASGTESNIGRLDPLTRESIYITETISRDNLDERKKIHYYPGGGIGMKINYNKTCFFIEANYHQSLNEILKKGTNRFDQNSVWTEGWFDSDFRLSKASIRVGFVKKFFLIRKTG